MARVAERLEELEAHEAHEARIDERQRTLSKRSPSWDVVVSSPSGAQRSSSQGDHEVALRLRTAGRRRIPRGHRRRRRLGNDYYRPRFRRVDSPKVDFRASVLSFWTGALSAPYDESCRHQVLARGRVISTEEDPGVRAHWVGAPSHEDHRDGVELSFGVDYDGVARDLSLRMLCRWRIAEQRAFRSAVARSGPGCRQEQRARRSNRSRMRGTHALLALTTLVATSSVAPATAAGLTSGPIEYVRTIPIDAGAAQVAERVGDHLYLTSWKALSVYDVSDLLNPVHVSTIPTGFQFPAERMDTNGEILIIGEQTPQYQLHVFDVSDPEAPAEIATLAGTPDHTFTCVLDCRWAYGSHGTIVDLADPANPRVAGDWNDPALSYWHDVTEVAPGRVLTASMPTMRLLDGRDRVTNPRHVAMGDAAATGTDGYLGTVAWPRGGRDRFILGSEETSFNPQCSDTTSAFVTWDASRWRQTRTFAVADSYRLDDGTVSDGSPPVSVVGCSTHVFDEHPGFRNGGLVTLAHYEHGTRLLEIGRDGSIEEVAWFLPAGGSTSASYWMSDEIVYSIDFHRGLDILRYTGDA